MIKKNFLIFLLSFMGAFVIQAQGLRIVSPHPDLKFKITRCEAAGKNVFIDYIVENLSSQDIKLNINNNGDDTDIRDDEGNKYGNRQSDIFLGNQTEDTFGTVSELLPPETPLKGRFKIVGVPESANMIKRLQIMISVPELGVNPYGRHGTDENLIIYNIPINRDGD